MRTQAQTSVSRSRFHSNKTLWNKRIISRMLKEQTETVLCETNLSNFALRTIWKMYPETISISQKTTNILCHQKVQWLLHPSPIRNNKSQLQACLKPMFCCYLQHMGNHQFHPFHPFIPEPALVLCSSCKTSWNWLNKEVVFFNGPTFEIGHQPKINLYSYLVLEPTRLKNISQVGSFPPK